jgi:hypothetical protein
MDNVERIFSDLSKQEDYSVRVARGGGNQNDRAIFLFIQSNINDLLRENVLLEIDDDIEVCDFGSGCGYTAIELAKENYSIDFVDFDAVLKVLKSSVEIENKLTFICTQDFKFHNEKKYNLIVMYSVVQYLYFETCDRLERILDFLFNAMMALKPRGRLLLGDLPDKSLRENFKRNYPCFSGSASKIIEGYTFEIDFNLFVPEFYSRIGDLALKAGCAMYILPQSPETAFNFIRKDVIIIKE